MNNPSRNIKKPQIDLIESEKQGNKSSHTQDKSPSMEKSNQNSQNEIKKRRSRIHRITDNRVLSLTERRLAELDILYRHRLANSDVFRVVLDGSNQQILRELRRLWDEGYVDRPTMDNAQKIPKRTRTK